MERSVPEQYEYTKQLFIGLIQEGNKLPPSYRRQLCQEIATEMLKDKARAQGNGELDLAILIMEVMKNRP